MKTANLILEKRKRGRPSKEKVMKEVVAFDPKSVKLIRGSQMKFDDAIFIPMKTGTEIDVILSTEGGLMPATNIVIVGGPGGGKSTLVLDILASLTEKGYKCLFVSAEMNEIAYYKYCKRMPKFNKVETLFLKNHMDNPKEVLEYVFDKGYDVIAVDSMAETIGMIQEAYDLKSARKAEVMFLDLQEKHKKGENKDGYYTSFINIQQVTKGEEFVGSNRLKHMTEGMAKIERSKDGLERTIHFEKNRDCDKDFKMNFTFYNGEVHYSYEQMGMTE